MLLPSGGTRFMSGSGSLSCNRPVGNCSSAWATVPSAPSLRDTSVAPKVAV